MVRSSAPSPSRPAVRRSAHRGERTSDPAAAGPPPPDRGASAALDRAETELITIFTDLSAALGLPRSLGQIYGLAFASLEPICFDDVVSKLHLSKGSASQGIRVLRELGALRPASEDSRGADAGKGKEVRAKGADADDSMPLAASLLPAASATGSARRDYLVPEVSVRALLGAVMRQRVQPPLASGAERLARLKAILPEGQNGGKGNGVRGKRGGNDSSLPPYPLPLAADLRTAHLRARIQSLESWHKKARGVLPFLLKLAGGRGEQR